MTIIKHTEGIWEVPNFLSQEACAELIARSEAAGYEDAKVRTHTGEESMPGIRNNAKAIVEWPELVDTIWKGVQSLELPALQSRLPAGLPRSLRFYRYAPGQRFKMHKDGPWKEDGLTSEWTFLIYLNEDFEGGRTMFRESATIVPKTGSALLFIHRTWHEGEEVTAGTKYALRSDVLYENALANPETLAAIAQAKAGDTTAIALDKL